METIDILNGDNEAAKILDKAKQDTCHDAKAIFGFVCDAYRYIDNHVQASINVLKG